MLYALSAFEGVLQFLMGGVAFLLIVCFFVKQLYLKHVFLTCMVFGLGFLVWLCPSSCPRDVQSQNAHQLTTPLKSLKVMLLHQTLLRHKAEMAELNSQKMAMQRICGLSDKTCLLLCSQQCTCQSLAAQWWETGTASSRWTLAWQHGHQTFEPRSSMLTVGRTRTHMQADI